MNKTPRNLLPVGMEQALTERDSEAQKIIKSFSEAPDSAALPEIIYHYTNDVGLRGILETGRLWLTDIFQLNDPSELRHGYCLAIDVLKSKSKGAKSPEPITKLIRDLEKFIQPGSTLESGNYFMCSFSSCGNDLGQWRSYADNGRGYALGFSKTLLETTFTNQGAANSPFRATFPISYSDQKLAELHGKVIDCMYDLIFLPLRRNLASEIAQEYRTQMVLRFATKFLLAGLFFKHEAYNNEREYRFLEIQGLRPEVKLRPRRYSSIRYREFDWKGTAPEALREIIVGPAAYDKATQFAKDCLKTFLSENVEVVSSKIPYRAI